MKGLLDQTHCYLMVAVIICLLTTPRKSLCGYSYYYDKTPDYSTGTLYTFTQDEIDAIVDEHNEIRAAVGATDMLKMVTLCACRFL